MPSGGTPTTPSPTSRASIALASALDLLASCTPAAAPRAEEAGPLACPHDAVRAAKGDRAGPYSLQAHYYSRGPMGYGMGKLEIIDHDGRGGLKFEERPFVVMADHAFVNLGTTN